MLFTKNLEYLIVKAVDLLDITLAIQMHGGIVLSTLRLLLYFHAIISSSCTLDMKCDLTARRLTLHACTVFFEADDALKLETLFIDFVEANSTLGLYYQAWNPSSAT